MLRLKNLLNNKVLVQSGEDTNFYTSSIQEFTEEYIAIAIPYHQRLPLILGRNELIQIKVYDQGEIYAFTTKVLGKKNETIPLYLLSIPEKVEKIQLRNYVRFSVSLDVSYKEIENGEIKQGRTIDISGGGMKLAVKKHLPEAERLFLKFTLPDNGGIIETTGKIVRHELLELPNGKLNSVALEFVDLRESQREQIIAFIFKRMVQQRNILK